MSQDQPLTEALRALQSLILVSEQHRHVAARTDGLGATEAQALTYLAAHADAGQTALRHHLGLTTSAATALIDRLEQKGMAKRRPDPQDRRRSFVRLTERGTKKISASQNWLGDVLEGVDPADLALISTSMALVAADLQARALRHANDNQSEPTASVAG